MPPRAIYEHSGPAELVLEGENLTPDTLKLYHNGVLYTPLESSETYAYYLLGDNGTNKVMLNGKNFSTIIVKDVVVPEFLPVDMKLYATSKTSAWTGNEDDLLISRTDINCLNVPVLVNDQKPNFIYKFTFTEADVDEFQFVNCSLNGTYTNEKGWFNINISVTDATKAAYIKYQGFIIAVFNYSA